MQQRQPRGSSRVSGVLAIGVALASTACATVFSDLQSARLVGRGKFELTPSASRVTYSGEDDSGHVQDHLGLQLAAGVHEKLDLRLRYEHISPDFEEGQGLSVVGFGPKLELVKDRVAAYVPVGCAFGRDVETSRTWQAQPTLLFSVPAHRSVELNASTKLIVPFSEGDTLAAFNFGLGLSPNPERWVLRPEVGFLFNPGESGHFTQFSLGLSIRPK